MISAALYDPDYLTRKGLEAIVRKSYAVTEWWSIEDADLAEDLKRRQPNLLIVNFADSSWHLADRVIQIARAKPAMKLLVVISNFDELEVQRLLKSGVKGFLTKECSREEFHLAIEKIMIGGMFYCQRVLELMQQNMNSEIKELSNRELQVIKLISKGHSSEQIADKLMLSIHTVNSHRKKILHKLGLKTPMELILHALKQKWV